MKRLTVLLTMFVVMTAASARTLVVYYSFTNNTATIVSSLAARLPGADVVRIEPAEEGLVYAADGYALGSALIAAIRENPDDASSYPEIKPVSVDLAAYDEIIVATPLWWSNMAAPMQTFLFHNGGQMTGKRVGLIVSSASSGISGVEDDAHRLIPGGEFVSPSLWIRSSQTGNCHDMIAGWLDETGLGGSTGIVTAANDAPVVRCVNGALSVDGSYDRLSVYDLAGNLLVDGADDAPATALAADDVYLVRVVSGQTEVVNKVVVTE